MTIPDPLPSPHVPDRVRRSRFHRSENPATVVLQPRDVFVLSDLFHFRFAKAQALYLSAYASGDSGMANWTKRISVLWDAGWMARFSAKFSNYVWGNKFFYYTLETGKASGIATTGLPYYAVPDEKMEAIIKASAPLRARLLDVLTTQGIPADRADAILQYNTDLACKYIAGETSDVRHLVLGSTALAILWFGARQMGATVSHILGDGAVNLSFDHEGKTVPIKPDGFFTIGEYGFALEAETGTSARHKIVDKVQRYLLLNREKGVQGVAVLTGASGMTSFRVLFHCQTDAHARMVEDVIAEALPKKGTGLFLVSRAGDLHLGDEPAGEKWGRDHFIKDLSVGDGTPLYTYLASRITAPIFSQVTGRDAGAAKTECIPLFSA
jgi:hypothetical protein